MEVPSVRYIHTQTQAQAELQRTKAANKASVARRKERIMNSSHAEIQAELERQTAVEQSES
jgi:hypothetical protein